MIVSFKKGKSGDVSKVLNEMWTYFFGTYAMIVSFKKGKSGDASTMGRQVKGRIIK